MKTNKRRFTTPIQITIFDQSRLIVDRVFEEYPVVIGRSPRAEICFPQFDFVSKQHAAIVEAKGEIVIVDLNSANGLYFQGKRTRKAPISDEGAISIGSLTFRFRVLASGTLAVGDDSTAHVVSKSQMPSAPDSWPSPSQDKKPESESPFQKSLQSNIESVQKPQKSGAASKPDSEVTLVSPKKVITPNQEKPSPQQRSQTPQSNGPTPQATKVEKPHVQHHARGSHHHDPIVSGFDLVEPYPHAKNIKPDQRVLEAFVTWKGTICDTQQFFPGEKVSVGRSTNTGLYVPTIQKRIDLAFFDGKKTQCFVPQGAKLRVRSTERELSMDDLMKAQAVTKWQSGYLLKLGNEELASFDIGPDIEIHFRYIPASRPLSRRKMIEPDEQFRRTTVVSGLIHGLIVAIAVLNAPAPRGPVLENVPERYARLLVEPPKPIVEKKPEPPPPPPEKEPEPPKVVERPKPKPPEKVVKRVVQKKPLPVAVKPSPVLKQTSNVPPNPKATSNSVSKNPAPVNVNTLGALSALTAVSANPSPSSQPVSININQNAGGPSKFTTTGVLGALKTSSGKLQAGGVQSVQTRGLGVGTGTGYGIQGIKGAAGSRGVAGGIIGSPQIMSVSPQEGLTRAQVMAVVKKHLGEIQQCYERSLFQAPTLAGKVEYEWDIQPSGVVSAVKVKSSQMSGADAMNSCVFAVFRKMKFPQAKNGMMTVPSIPLEFGKL